jgi:aminomuconate-semialdehyde/2-hydroxymuconate-6-semialdehyde dehydrogenase
MSDLKLPEKLENLVGGKLQAPRNGAYISSTNPSNGELLCLVPDSGVEDLEEAVQAAKSAFGEWRDVGVEARAKIMNRLADLLDENLSKFIRAEVLDNGMTWGFASSVEVPRGAQNLRSFAKAALDFCQPVAFEQAHAKGYVRHQPVGVVATITPWNLPLLSLTWKIAPALASGNCVIAKPSEVTPVTAYLLSTLVKEAGFPPGVLNILHGTGPGIGSLMTRHKDILRMSFTGSTATGRIIGIACAEEFKKPPCLEMGGKNPSIVFADARLEAAAECVSRAAFANQGQVCLSGSRIYVEKSIYENFKAMLIERASRYKPADPLLPDTKHGATVSEAHMKKVLSCIDLARSEGGKLLCGGERVVLSGDCANGYFIRPTLFEGLGIETRTNQEEIFGPVSTISPFETEEEAVALANNSEYGLSASIWTEDSERATRVADALDTGMPWINCWNLRVLETPFGGFKNSGNGHREGVPDAMEFFTEKKTVMMPNSG